LDFLNDRLDEIVKELLSWRPSYRITFSVFLQLTDHGTSTIFQTFHLNAKCTHNWLVFLVGLKQL